MSTKTLNTQNCLMQYNIILETINQYSVTVTTTNCVGGADNPTSIIAGGTVTFEFQASSGYKMPSTAPTVTGATVTSWTVSTVSTTDDTGTLVLSNPTGNVSFTVEGEEI